MIDRKDNTVDEVGSIRLRETIKKICIYMNLQRSPKNEIVDFWHEIKHGSHPIFLLIRYGISGLFVGIFYVLLGYLLSNWIGLSVPIAVTLSYIVTTPIAFTLQKKFTFKSDIALSKELPRFIVVGIFLLALSTVTHKFVILPIPLIMQLFVFWLLSSILNFLAYKFWVFSQV
jgi:putative flippase GtrA